VATVGNDERPGAAIPESAAVCGVPGPERQPNANAPGQLPCHLAAPGAAPSRLASTHSLPTRRGRAGAARQAGALADSMRGRTGAACVRTAQVVGVYGGGYASPRAQSPGRSSSPIGLYVSPMPQPPAVPPDVMVFSAFNPGMPSPAQTSPRYPSPVQQRPYAQHRPHPAQVQVPAAHAWRRAGPSETERIVYRSMSPNSIMPAGAGERGRAPVRHRHPSPDYAAGRYATVERPAVRYARLRHAMLLAAHDPVHALLYLRQSES
jgi:hypothetical protein